jgi:hypothetical protein
VICAIAQIAFFDGTRHFAVRVLWDREGKPVSEGSADISRTLPVQSAVYRILWGKLRSLGKRFSQFLLAFSGQRRLLNNLLCQTDHLGQKERCHKSARKMQRAHGSGGMSDHKPEPALKFDLDAPPDPQPLGDPVLSARDVIAIVYSAFETIDADEDELRAIQLDVIKTVGEGRVGLAVHRAIVGASSLRDE